jgi:hypothetical protein
LKYLNKNIGGIKMQTGYPIKFANNGTGGSVLTLELKKGKADPPFPGDQGEYINITVDEPDQRIYEPEDGKLEFILSPYKASQEIIKYKVEAGHNVEFHKTGHKCILNFKNLKTTSSDSDVIIQGDPPTNVEVEIDEPGRRKQSPKGK